jgi:hypothetical protein
MSCRMRIRPTRPLNLPPREAPMTIRVDNGAELVSRRGRYD